MSAVGKLSIPGRLKLMDFSTGVTPPDDRVIALYTDVGTSIEVPTVYGAGLPTGYQRQPIVFNSATSNLSTGAAEATADDVEFGPAETNWGSIRSIAIWTNPPAPETPTIIWSSTIDPPIPVDNTQRLRFWPGLIKLSLE